MSNSNEKRNLETTKLFYAEAAAGNWAAINAMLSDNLVISEGESLPYAGVYRGKSALVDVSTKVHAYYGGMALDIHEICAGGDWVVTLLDIRPDGKEERVSLAEASRFDDEGKIIEIKPFYFDHDQVKRLAAAG